MKAADRHLMTVGREIVGIVKDLIVARTSVLFVKSGRFLAFPEGGRIQAISGSMIQSSKSLEIDCVFPLWTNISSFRAQCAWIEMTVQWMKLNVI
jgi:hypothetical protein